MKKINLKGISEILSEKELKNVMGGSDNSSCFGKQQYDSCVIGSKMGTCRQCGLEMCCYAP